MNLFKWCLPLVLILTLGFYLTTDIPKSKKKSNRKVEFDEGSLVCIRNEAYIVDDTYYYRIRHKETVRVINFKNGNKLNVKYKELNKCKNE